MKVPDKRTTITTKVVSSNPAHGNLLLIPVFLSLCTKQENRMKIFVLYAGRRTRTRKCFLKWSGWNQKKKMHLKMVSAKPEGENAS
jgi:hypothetical protein